MSLVSDAADLTLLREGELTVVGRIMDASNATLLCEITDGEREAHCVYKPVLGERPLWDFPDGTLAGREVAAYLVSAETGWDFVPPTVLRDGEFGSGMVQLWVDGDETVDLVEYAQSASGSLRLLSVFDAVINNSDRKGGHLIPRPEPAGTPVTDYDCWGVDHGVAFSVEDKLRTVLWRWAGEELPAAAVDVLERLCARFDEGLGDALEEHLTVAEVARTRERVRRLLRTRRHPEPSGDWPPVPYPPF